MPNNGVHPTTVVAHGLAGIALTLVVTACGAPTPSGPVSATPPSVAAAATPAAEEPSTPSEVATFGQRYTFESGLAIDVAQPEKYTPSNSAAGNDTGRAVLVTTTVTNGTDQPFDFNPFLLGPNATHSGQPASQVIDSAKKIGITAGSTILPGKSLTYKTAIAVQSTKGELQLEYKEGFAGSPAIFIGEV
jgi:hypothetical protein